MSEGIWICDAVRDSQLIRGFWSYVNNENAATSYAENAWALVRKIEAGAPALKGELPARLFHSRQADFREKLPPFFHSSLMVINRKAADVVRSHNIGDAIISPVELYQNDQTTRISGDYFVLCPGNPTKTIDLENTKGVKKRYPRQELYKLPLFFDDNSVITLSKGEISHDIWVDPLISGGPFFMSDRLADALENAGLRKAFRLRPTARLTD